jgi:hypothetical protein
MTAMTGYQQPTYLPSQRPRWSGRQKIVAFVALVAPAAIGLVTVAVTASPDRGCPDRLAQAKHLHLCQQPGPSR